VRAKLAENHRDCIRATARDDGISVGATPEVTRLSSPVRGIRSAVRRIIETRLARSVPSERARKRRAECKRDGARDARDARGSRLVDPLKIEFNSIVLS